MCGLYNLQKYTTTRRGLFITHTCPKFKPTMHTIMTVAIPCYTCWTSLWRTSYTQYHSTVLCKISKRWRICEINDGQTGLYDVCVQDKLQGRLYFAVTSVVIKMAVYMQLWNLLQRAGLSEGKFSGKICWISLAYRGQEQIDMRC